MTRCVSTSFSRNGPTATLRVVGLTQGAQLPCPHRPYKPYRVLCESYGPCMALFWRHTRNRSRQTLQTLQTFWTKRNSHPKKIHFFGIALPPARLPGLLPKKVCKVCKVCRTHAPCVAVLRRPYTLKTMYINFVRFVRPQKPTANAVGRVRSQCQPRCGAARCPHRRRSASART